MIVKFTIFTPTYNRVEHLKLLYDSLLNQTYKNFEWIVIDDGSTDATRSLFKNKILVESPFHVDYFYKENGGKQRAYNQAINMAKGKFFICLDSDDLLVPECLCKLNELWDALDNKDNLSGITFLSLNKVDKKIIGTKFPSNMPHCNMYDAYNKFNVKGDKGIMFISSVIKKYLFPVFPGELFTTEALLYNRIGVKYNFIHSNLELQIKEYQPDGLSASYRKLLKSNPQGSALYYHEMFYMSSDFKNRAKSTILSNKYKLFSHVRYIDIILSSPNRIYSFFLFPIACYLYFKEQKL